MLKKTFKIYCSLLCLMCCLVAMSIFSISFCRAETKPQKIIKNQVSYLERLVNISNPRPSLKIKLWLSAAKETLAIGSPIHFLFQASRDCYLTLLDISTDGAINVLFPNKFRQQNYIKAGKTYNIPGDYNFEMKVTGPEGLEKIKAIATLKPVDLFEFDFSKNAFDSMPFGDSRAMRGVGGIKSNLKQQDWAETTISFTIKKQTTGARAKN